MNGEVVASVSGPRVDVGNARLISGSRAKKPKGIITMTESEERRELRDRRDVLTRRAAELEREIQRLHGTNDRRALRALQEQLKQHEEDLKVFDEHLAMFHARYGPIGQKEDQD